MPTGLLCSRDSLCCWSPSFALKSDSKAKSCEIGLSSCGKARLPVDDNLVSQALTEVGPVSRIIPQQMPRPTNVKIMAVPGSSDFIQLLPYDGVGTPKYFQNLSRCSASGESLWIAELPTRSDGDAHVDAQIEGNRIIAWSWSCYRVELSIDSGAVEKSVFTT
jgi:hypothetical protein